MSMRPVTTAWYSVRVAYLALIMLFLAGVLFQAYSAGRYIFGVTADNALHAELGWPLAHGFSLLVFLASLFVRGGRRVWVTSIVWFLMTAMLPILAVWNEEGMSPIEALHPLLAMVVLLLGALLAWQAWRLVAAGRVGTGSPETASDRGVEAP